MRQFIFLFMTSIFLTSCGRHSDGSSVWIELWVIPWATGIGAAVTFWVAWKASKSGSKINPIYGGGEGGNVSIWKTGWIVFSIVLAVITAIIIWAVNSEK